MPVARPVLGVALAIVLAVGCGKKPAPAPESRTEPGGGDAVVDGSAPEGGAWADPRPGTRGPAWSTAGARVPLKPDSRVTFGPSGCPVFVVDQDVYDAKTLKPVRRIPDQYDRHAVRVLSADGKLFAATTDGADNPPVHVYDTDAGKKAVTLPGIGRGISIKMLRFYAGTHLLIGTPLAPVFDLWDISTGKRAGGVKLPTLGVTPGAVAVTRDGRFIAVVSPAKLAVVETRTAAQVASMAPPATPPGEKSTVSKLTPFIEVDRPTFSPDGSELAAFTNGPYPRILVWNRKGQLVDDVHASVSKFATDAVALEWLPDGSGWLFGGRVIDRATRRPTVVVRGPFSRELHPHLLDPDRLAARHEGVFDDLRVVTLPRARVQAALKAVLAGAEAHVAPGRPVALDLAGVSDDEGRAQLAQMLTRRLARDGIPVAAKAATVLRVRPTGEPGPPRAVRDRQTPGGRTGPEVGMAGTDASRAGVIELVAAGESAPLWREHLFTGTLRTFAEEIRDPATRRIQIDVVGMTLDRVEVPYFVPKDRGTLALPAVID